MRPAVRKALRMEQDREPLEAVGVRRAEAVGLRARVRAVRAWEDTGDPSHAARVLFAALLDYAPVVGLGMAVAHVTGVNRTRLNLEAAGKVSRGLRLSTTYESALSLLRKRLALDPQQEKDLRQRYGEVAASAVTADSAAAASTVEQSLIDSIQAGEGERLGTQRLRQALTSAGLVPGANHRLATMFRTQTQLAYSAGRISSLRDPAVDEILWGFEYVTVGDDRVRPSHARMDGVKRPKDDAIWTVWTPPNGYNCRCAVLEVFDKGTENDVPADTWPDKGFDFNPGDVVRDLDTPTVPVKPKAVPKPRAPRPPKGYTARTSASKKFRADTQAVYRTIPQRIRNRVAKAGGTLDVCEFSTDGSPHLKTLQPRGWPPGSTFKEVGGYYIPGPKRAVVSEKILDKYNGFVEETVNRRRWTGTLYHEWGHAVDHLWDESRGPITKSNNKFLNAYFRDLQAITDPIVKARLDYFLQPGDTGPSEAFAEGFAIHMGEGGSSSFVQDDFKKAFPNVLAEIKRITGLK